MSSPQEGTHAWGTQPEMFGPRHEHRLALILRETAKLPPGARVLEAAVGLGQLAARMRRDGHLVFGVDGAFAAALHATRVAGVPSVVGDLTRLPFRTASFDGVTSGETLEHLDDDVSAVAEIGRVMRPEGRCVVTVPALRALWTASDDYYEHRRRYSRRDLRALFERARFRVEKARFWGFPVVLTYDTLFLLPMNRRRARRKPDEDAALRSVASAGRSRALVRLVRTAFSIDRLFGFIPFGPGLLLVAKKQP
ncbi:MAG TPA: class I SAM-dependent methyltransferase [Thermoanaerobaculia bacterium]|nr:class I SAM-dependent methyltransferase [Thermoanaerobaculia bacterium]